MATQAEKHLLAIWEADALEYHRRTGHIEFVPGGTAAHSARLGNVGRGNAGGGDEASMYESWEKRKARNGAKERGEKLAAKQAENNARVRALLNPKSQIKVKAAKPRKPRTSTATFVGNPCRVCGGTLRYVRRGKCVACRGRLEREYDARRVRPDYWKENRREYRLNKSKKEQAASRAN